MIFKKKLFSFFLFLYPIFSRTIPGIAEKEFPSEKSKIDYTLYQKILQEVVNEQGDVHYYKLKAKISFLREFIKNLQKIDPNNLSQEDEFAFYINFYNSVVLYQVAQYYPFRSVMTDFPGGDFFKNEFYFQGKTISLDYLENEILRKKFKNPYIHFALNCASRSCPILEGKPWQAKNLKDRLRKAASRYLKNVRHNRYDKEKNILYLSELFRWYQEDFGDLLGFFEKHTGIKIPPNTKIEYLTYDWSLNEQKP